MLRINDIKPKLIEDLDETQLTELLNLLIGLEHRKYNFPKYKNYVSSKTKVADGAEDGRFECDSYNGSSWLSNTLILFQCKASELKLGEYRSEVIEEYDKTPKKPKKWRVKARIKSVIENGGTYIVFTSHNIGAKQNIETRIAKIREAIKETGEIQLSIDAKIEIYDAEKIRNWVNEYLPAKNYIWSLNGALRTDGFLTWEFFARPHKKYNYVLNDKLNEFIAQIRSHVNNEKRVLRLTGLSGLGKSRLVMEAFNPNLGAEAKALSDSILYCSIGNNADEYIHYLNSVIDYQGIVILDNCDLANHRRIEELARYEGKLKFITIDYDLTPTNASVNISLKSEMFQDVVLKMLKNSFGSRFREDEITQIAQYTEGYPQLAVAIAEAISEKRIDNISSYLDGDQVAKLIFGRGKEDDNEYKVIQILSLFRAVQIPRDEDLKNYNEEYKVRLLEHIKFVSKRFLGNIELENILNFCNKFEERGLMERRGNMMIVKPLPLALSLATNWWNRQYSISKIQDIFMEIKDSETILVELAERLKQLDGVPRIKEIFESLFGPEDSPFGKAEVLNSRWGSRFFRSVIEVNPVSMTETLWSLYGYLPKEELIKVNIGRRDLIWSLEKLCFRKDTFDKAAKVLCNFAIAENENFGNNATQQFLQLFQIHLASTQVGFSERVEIIKWCLSKDKDYRLLALSAIGRALMTRGFHRMGGAEYQGSSMPLEDYKPKSHNEIWVYRQTVSQFLFDIALNELDVDLSTKAQAVIAANIEPILTCTPEVEKIRDILLAINSKREERWHELYRSIRHLIKYKKGVYSNDYTHIFNELSDKLAPSDIKERLKSFVSSPSYEYINEDEMDRISDVFNKKTMDLANELSENLSLLLTNLDVLYEGNQQQGYLFGENLAMLIPNSVEFVEKSLQILESIEPQNQNPAVLLGYFDKSVDKSFLRPYYDYIFNSTQLYHNSFNFVRHLNPDDALIYQLFELIDSNKQTIFRFNNFIWGPFLESQFDSERLIKLCERISMYKGGAWLSIALFDRYINLRNEGSVDWKGCKKAIKHLIQSHNFSLDSNPHEYMLGIMWKQMLVALLKEGTDEKFVKSMSKHIIKYFDSSSFDNSRGVSEDNVLSILKVLLKNYFVTSWKIIGDAILNDAYTYFQMKLKMGFVSDYDDILCLENNFDVLSNWCLVNQPKAAERIIRLIPYNTNDGKWHPFMLKLIDDFGSDERLLREISAKIHSFGSIGSRVPYLESRKNLMSQLLGHSISQVREWAKVEVDYLTRDIKAEKIENEEWSLR
jgi:hypothetical protein